MSTITENRSQAEQLVSQFELSRGILNQGSSPLLNRIREVSIKRFAKMGIPDFKNEDYKYTNLKPAFEKSYLQELVREPGLINLNEIFKCNVPQLDTHLVFLVNGWFYSGNNPGAELPKGVVLGGLEQIANEHPELIENYLNRQAGLSNDPFVALNTAFAKDGFFMYIPKGVVVEKPVQVINLLSSDENLMATQRNLIIADADSRVKILVCDHTLTAPSVIFNIVSEVYVGEGAVVDVYIIQNHHNQSTTINSTFYKQERNSTLITGAISLHGGLIRNNLKVTFNGDHSEASIYGISFTDKKQHVDNFTLIEHASPNCTSNQIYKNVLDNESTGAFAGRIHVARDAQQTNAFQRNNNVLLSDKARMQTKPQLIIDADDVKCSHGATVGQIDEEALFFLRARGIGEKEARMMLMNAFAHEVIQKITIEPLRNQIDELIEKRLKGEISLCHDCNYKCNS
ncbi:MAG TPA: Fe-S cluster assembly protein SufD [Prolixibacteraceae bacterium]|jgi:Fe-S cluster assembly protein SufD|nr:Fe-S cluster assembly protein SufD [Prolixibacteraceae bacterium]